MTRLKFGDPETLERIRAAKTPIAKMQTSFGVAAPGQLCGDCIHFDDRYEKNRCTLFNRTHHTEGSWPEHAIGCGKFERKEP